MAKVKLGKKEFLVDCDVIDANGCEVSAADCNALCARMRSGEINRVTELFLVRFFFDWFILHFCAGCNVPTFAVQGHNQICDDGAKAIAEILKEKSCVQKLWIVRDIRIHIYVYILLLALLCFCYIICA